MKVEFKNIGIFIKKYFSSFGNEEVSVSFVGKTIEIESGNFSFGINIIASNNQNFIFDARMEKISSNKIKDITNKLLIYLNKNISLPLSIKLGKQITNFSQKSVFVFGNDGDLDNLSEQDTDLLTFSDTFYTNDTDGLTKLLSKLNFKNKNIFEINNIYDLDFDNITDIVLFQFGDYLENHESTQINAVNKYLKDYFDNFYIFPYYSNFINKYSLSHSNYGNFFYSGSYDKKTFISNGKNILKYIENFLYYTKEINSNKVAGQGMLADSSFGIDFKDLETFESFNSLIKDIENINEYTFEILFDTIDGYFDKVDRLEDFDISNFRHEKNISNISVFIFKIKDGSIVKKFIGYEKFNSLKSGKNFTFLSSSLSKPSEFTRNTISNLTTSKYIFGETAESIRKFFDRLNITYDDKKIYFADDLILVDKYVQEYKKNNGKECFTSHPDLIPEVLPELVDLLNAGQKCYFVTDGGTPCILDPGDNIKKYIGLHHREYSIFGIKGPSIIPTVLLGCQFEFKTIFWAPLLYAIYPGVDLLNKIDFFAKDKLKDTLMIFYSFGKEIEKDIEVFNNLFEDINIQVLGDIGTKQEYNEVFSLKKIGKEKIDFINNNIENVVYLLKY